MQGLLRRFFVVLARWAGHECFEDRDRLAEPRRGDNLVTPCRRNVGEQGGCGRERTPVSWIRIGRRQLAIRRLRGGELGLGFVEPLAPQQEQPRPASGQRHLRTAAVRAVARRHALA